LTAETYARLEVRRATATDLDAVLSTLEEAARWMVRQNVEGWTPEGFSRRRIAYLIERRRDVPRHARRRARRDLRAPVG
jgi:hypothetical protein